MFLVHTKWTVFMALGSLLIVLDSGVPVLAATGGTVEATITWQYNEYVGTKGDVGAKVILFPEHISHRLNSARRSDADIINELAIGIVAPDAERLGFRGTEADGYGKAVVDDVPPGFYVVLVISHDTTRDFNQPVTDSDLDMLRSYFATDASFARMKHSALLNLQKFWLGTVEVYAGETAHLSNDFGNTHI